MLSHHCMQIERFPFFKSWEPRHKLVGKGIEIWWKSWTVKNIPNQILPVGLKGSFTFVLSLPQTKSLLGPLWSKVFGDHRSFSHHNYPSHYNSLPGNKGSQSGNIVLLSDTGSLLLSVTVNLVTKWNTTVFA